MPAYKVEGDRRYTQVEVDVLCENASAGGYMPSHQRVSIKPEGDLKLYKGAWTFSA